MQIEINTYKEQGGKYVPIQATMQLPGKWSEVTATQFTGFCMALCTNDFFRSLFFKWCALPMSVVKLLKRKHLNTFAQSMEWIGSKMAFETLHISEIRVPGNLFKWYGYGDGFKYLRVIDFGTADTFLTAYHVTKDAAWLHKFIAVLYRPTNLWIYLRNIYSHGDKRIPYNEHTLELRAKKAAKLPDWQKKAIEYNFIAIRATKVEAFKIVFAAGEDKPDFMAWAKVTCSSAGSELGTINQVEQILINHFLFYCDNLISQQKRINTGGESPNKQTIQLQ